MCSLVPYGRCSGFSIAGTEYLTSPKAHRRLLSAFHTHMTAIFLVLSSLSRTAYLHCRPAVATDMVDGNRTPFPMPSLRRPGHCPCNAILTLGTFATGDCMACRRMHVQRIRTSLRIEEKPPPTPTGGSACTCSQLRLAMQLLRWRRIRAVVDQPRHTRSRVRYCLLVQPCRQAWCPAQGACYDSMEPVKTRQMLSYVPFARAALLMLATCTELHSNNVRWIHRAAI